MDADKAIELLGTTTNSTLVWILTWLLAYVLMWIAALAAYAGVSLVAGPGASRRLSMGAVSVIAMLYAPLPASFAAFGSWTLLALSLGLCATPWALVLLSMATDWGPSRPRALLRARLDRSRGHLGAGVTELVRVRDTRSIEWLLAGRSTVEATRAIRNAAQAGLDLDDTIDAARRGGLVPDATLTTISSRGATATAVLARSCDRLAMTRGPADDRGSEAVRRYVGRVDRLRNALERARDDVIAIGVKGPANPDASVVATLVRLDKATRGFESDLLGIDHALVSDPDRTALESSLDQSVAVVLGRMPGDAAVLDRVTSIRNSILSILARDPRLDLTDPNVFAVQQTALSYLPEALDAYLRVPSDDGVDGDARDRAHALLVEQLDILDRAMRDANGAVAAHDIDRLAAHGRFLREKFRSGTLTIHEDARLR